jgi:hypothetical protein
MVGGGLNHECYQDYFAWVCFQLFVFSFIEFV